MYNQGDIVLVPIPFSDLSSNKKRPVIIISNDSYNSKTDDVLVAAITSNLEVKDYTIFISNEDLSAGELKVDCIIRIDKLYSLSQNIIVTKLGTAKNYIIKSITDKLNLLITGSR